MVAWLVCPSHIPGAILVLPQIWNPWAVGITRPNPREAIGALVEYVWLERLFEREQLPNNIETSYTAG